MSTLTPNYGLIVPDNTDTVAQVRADYATNLGIIDNNLGGGGGSSSLAGLTDVSLSSPTNGQVLSYNSVSQKWENANGGGGSGDTYNVYGAFIDTANVIVSRTSYHGNDSYTATEDCFVSYEVACPANDNAYVEIDGVAVCEFYFPMVCFASDNIPLKAGQTISFSNAYSGYSSYYTVYGITQGVNQVGHHYSTSEQVIGTWTNGKPLYERTFEFNDQVIPDLSWTNNILGGNLATIQIKNYDGYFGLEGLDWEADFDYFQSVSEYFTANSTVHDLNVRPNMNAGVNVTLKRVTIQYTKSTD